MSTSTSTERDAEGEGTNERSGATAAVARYGRNGSLAMLAGAGLLVRAASSRGRTAVQAVAGAALFGLGLRQRRTGGETSASGDETSASGGETQAPDDASVAGGAETTTQGRVSEGRGEDDATDANPRGTSGEPEVETKTSPDEGDVRFVDERDGVPRSRPQLDESTDDDPRRDDGDGPETVDLSEASMADEASEATGPSPEQAYPSLEGTDPEPMSEKAPQRYGEGAAANPDAEDGHDDETADEPTRADDAGDGETPGGD